jgi:ATP-dependent RNA helicase SUPV3L1/SUV3
MRLHDAPTTTAILGPTNTGKTHEGITRMLMHPTGLMGFPLRLLAREAYERVKAKVGADRVALLTGEERIGDPNADYVCATTEAMPTDREFFFVGQDEVQLAEDPDRGHLFTERLLHARGTRETLLLGAATMRDVVDDLLPGAVESARPRLSTLSFAGAKKLARLPPRSAVVAFSAAEVYRIAELLRREKGGAAVVLGALSPRARNAQVALFQSGEVDHIVATDAIGMGLNLDVGHVAFASIEKWDGTRFRTLRAAEVAQIAGRAGRAKKDGTFGTTLDCPPMPDALVHAVSEHRFDVVSRIFWRARALEFTSIDALLASLERGAPHARLMRKHDALDHETLRTLAHDPAVRVRATTTAHVELLWACCQIPDFRDERTDAHRDLVRRLFLLLADGDGRLPKAFVTRGITRLDDATGDVDMLTTRISHVRTWAYVAHREEWVANAREEQERARDVEDRLSDALHRALTERFVDRVARVLVSRTDEEIARATTVDASGQVVVSGEALGELRGWRAEAAPRALHDESRAARAKLFDVAARAVMTARVDALLAEHDPPLEITDAAIVWQGAPVATLVKGPRTLLPDVRIDARTVEPREREALENHLRTAVRRTLARVFAPLIDDDKRSLPPLARALVYRLLEARGTILTDDAHDVLDALTREDILALRARGISKGALTVDTRALHKRDAVAWRRALALLDDPARTLPATDGSLSSIAVDDDVREEGALALGYVVVGARAFRADLLERVLLRVDDSARTSARFALDHAWLAMLGSRIDDVTPVLARVGYVRDDDGLFTRPRALRPRSRARGAHQPRSVSDSRSPDAASRRDHTRAHRG